MMLEMERVRAVELSTVLGPSPGVKVDDPYKGLTFSARGPFGP